MGLGWSSGSWRRFLDAFGRIVSRSASDAKSGGLSDALKGEAERGMARAAPFGVSLSSPFLAATPQFNTEDAKSHRGHGERGHGEGFVSTSAMPPDVAGFCRLHGTACRHRCAPQWLRMYKSDQPADSTSQIQALRAQRQNILI
jgi:hypothetical protein